jgi:hypothetical protein
MLVESFKYKEMAPTLDADLVLTFGENDFFKTEEFFNSLRTFYPNAIVVGCSSSGNIIDTSIEHEDIVVMAVKLEKSSVKMVQSEVNINDSRSVADKLAKELASDSLKHVLIFSEGLNINGSDLADGFNEFGFSSSGGLAGDGTAFSKTFVIANEVAKSNIVVSIGIYGEAKVGTGSFAGFEEFGVEKIITKSSGNIVYEIDGEPALDMYKKYLGPSAEGLPLSGLYFPISKKSKDSSTIRTLLGVEHNENSLTFAGTVEENSVISLMKSNIDKLIDNASLAAESAKLEYKTGFSLVVSCVGRMIIMKQLVEEELEEVYNVLELPMIGFYSYGELAPHIGLKDCVLHNQTITVTTVYED